MKKGITIILITLTVLLVGLTKIKASTYGYIYSDNVKYGFGNDNWYNPTYGNGYWSFDDSNNSSQELYYFKFNQVTLPNNANSINVNIRFNVTSWKDQQITSNSPFTCTVNSHTEWLNIDDTSSPMQDDYEFQIDDFVCQSYNTTTKTYNNDFGLSLYYVSNSGITDYYPCYAVSYAGNVYNFSCPIQSNNISGYRIVLNANSDLDYTISMANLSVYNTDTTQAIIENQNQNTQAIIEQNATYEDTPNKDLTNETQEMNDFENAEQGLINSLDFNMTIMDGITINPNASAYIWQIVERLRQINPAIILLMTSILGMGIIKLVLNR